MTDPVTRTQLENANLDAVSLGNFVNDTASPGTYSTRTGRVGKTLARIQADAEAAGGNLANIKLPARVYCVGDSITAVGSSTAVGNYPAKLQTRLTSRDDGSYLVLNKGISGEPANWIMNRLANDVLLAGDASYAIILAGVNDLRWGTGTFSEQDIKSALQAMYTAAKAKGATVVACTIMPWKGYSEGDFSWTADRQTITESINSWIKTTATDVDFVVDTYAAFNDLANPGQLLPQYDDGSHLHITGSEGPDEGKLDGTDHLAQTIYDGITWAGRVAIAQIDASGQAVVNQDVTTTGSPQFWGLTVDNSGYNDTGTYYPAFNISNVSHAVSIGTATAYRPFVVSNRGQAGLEIGPGNLNSADPQNTVTQLHYNRLLNSYVTASYLASDYAWKIGTTTKAVLAGTGYLGIGTAAPTYRFVASEGGALGWEIDTAASSTQINWLIYDRVNANYGTVALSAAAFRVNPDGTAGSAWTFDADGLYPVTDNSVPLGKSGNRPSVIWSATGTISTSDGDKKTKPQPFSDGLIAAGLACASLPGVWQWLDAVEKKGAESARLHIGPIYQDVKAAFEEQGLDALRYGICCEDPVTRRVEKTRMVRRQKIDKKQVPAERRIVEGGKAILKTVMVEQDIPVTIAMHLHDEAGEPLFDVAYRPVMGADGKQVFEIVNGQRQPKTKEVRRPLIHLEPVMEDVPEKYFEDEVVPDKTDKGLRHIQLLYLMVAALAAKFAKGCIVVGGSDFTARFEAPGGKPFLKAYPDPLTGGEPWTIGLGHTGPDVRPDSVWPEDQCLHAFANDYAVAGAAALHVVGASVWAGLNEARRAVLTDMAYNIGPTRLRGFVKMLAAIRKGDWQEAAAQMLDSAYAHQVKGRAKTNAKTLLTGEMP